MTLANKITLFRFVLIPIMIVIMFIPYLRDTELSFFHGISIAQLIIGILFVVGSLSDFLDGYVARKYNQVTTFGKFLDPIADKVLVLLALVYMLSIEVSIKGSASSYLVIVIMIVLLREFLVTGVRLVVSEKGIVIPASFYGKIKTASQMVALIFILFNEFGIPYFLETSYINLSIGSLVLCFSTIMVIFSGVDYLYKSRQYIFESM